MLFLFSCSFCLILKVQLSCLKIPKSHALEIFILFNAKISSIFPLEELQQFFFEKYYLHSVLIKGKTKQ